MVCPRCKELGQKSRIYNSSTYSTTAMNCPSYYDEDGKYHHHDANTSSTSMSCSNGHKLYVTLPKSCPSCNWGYKGKIFVQEYCGPSFANENITGTVGVMTISGFDAQNWKQVGEYELEGDVLV